MKILFLSLLSYALTLGLALGQTGSPASLDNLESTYHANLMKAQLPLFQQYLKDLQILLEKSPETDRDAIRFEIVRINGLISEGKPIDLTQKKDEPDTDEKPIKKRGIIFTLDPEETKPPHPKDSTLALGQAVWTFSKLPAGKYELVGLCACPVLPATPTVSVAYHGASSSVEVTAKNLTKTETAFRPMSLGTFVITEDVLKEDITISTAGEKPWLFVKQIRLIKLKD